MVLVPSNLAQTRLRLSWGKSSLDYSEQFLSTTTLAQGATVTLITAPLAEQGEKTPNQAQLLLRLGQDLEMAQQLEASDLPSDLPRDLPLSYTCLVSDASILALLQLLQTELQTELQTPQLLNQMFADSILQVLVVHVLRQWHEQGDQPKPADETASAWLPPPCETEL